MNSKAPISQLSAEPEPARKNTPLPSSRVDRFAAPLSLFRKRNSRVARTHCFPPPSPGLSPLEWRRGVKRGEREVSDKTSEERRGGAFSSFSLSWRRRRKRRERRGSRLVFRRSKEEGKEGEQEKDPVYFLFRKVLNRAVRARFLGPHCDTI